MPTGVERSAAVKPRRSSHVSGPQPGITRRRTGRGWRYLDAAGLPIHDPATLARIGSLAVPPAYRDVWISADPDWPLQAVGRDARGRKQYRYHPQWRESREATKYRRVLSFVQALPRLRERVAADLRRRGLPQDKVVATAIRLMETSFIRIGNEEYARQNRSFGLTTLRKRHARVAGSAVELSFRAKSGIRRHLVIRDRPLASLVGKLREIPGQTLFQYIDAAGRRRRLGSAEVNAYLRKSSGADITAKDFRTWAGTFLAATALANAPDAMTKAARKRTMLAVIARVAESLGNTPAICRKCYIHPAILEAHMDGTLSARYRARATVSHPGLSEEEAAVMALLDGAT